MLKNTIAATIDHFVKSMVLEDLVGAHSRLIFKTWPGSAELLRLLFQPPTAGLAWRAYSAQARAHRFTARQPTAQAQAATHVRR